MPDGSVCGRPGRWKGVCAAHAAGRAPRSKRTGATCRGPDCNLRVRRRGLCQQHHKIHERGETLRPLPPFKLRTKITVNARVTTEAFAFFQDHAKKRGMSHYALFTEIFDGWYEGRLDHGDEHVNDVELSSRASMLKEFLDTRFYGATRLEIQERFPDEYEALTEKGSAGERRFYRDASHIGVKSILINGLAVYLAPQHAHRRREEVDNGDEG